MSDPRMSPTARLAGVALAAAALALLGAWLPARAADEAPPAPLSVAEQAVFASAQLAGLRPPLTLAYTFRRTGTLEAGVEGPVTIALKADASGACCAAHGEFLTGAARLELPDLEHADANPVTLFFLEHDVREMKRRTGGSTTYFRKRLRMAIYQGAEVRDIRVRWQGRDVPAREITVVPYADDPNRARFEQYVGRRYHFVLADAVPGRVYAIRSVLGDPAAPLLAEELLVEGGRSTLQGTP